MAKRRKSIRVRARPLFARYRTALASAYGANVSIAVGGYRIGYRSADRRAYVTLPGGYGGRISEGGTYRPSEIAGEVDIEVVRNLVARPLLVANAAAALAIANGTLPRCLCCGRPIMSEENAVRGIGSGCWETWGWANWPKEE